MTTLNYLCANDISDNDCYRCAIHGIYFRCPKNCKDFHDVRSDMDEKTLETRSKLMKILGREDRLPWEDDND